MLGKALCGCVFSAPPETQKTVFTATNALQPCPQRGRSGFPWRVKHHQVIGGKRSTHETLWPSASLEELMQCVGVQQAKGSLPADVTVVTFAWRAAKADDTF